MSSSSSPCAACKFLRRKCTQECVFAPYFPADQPQRFANVHKVFGASNVAKILNEIDVAHREDAVNSLAYEAEARLRDPVYGCVGLISLMQRTLKDLQLNLDDSKKELASLVGPTTMMQMLRNPYFQAQFHPNAAGAASSSHPGGGPSSSNPGAPMAPYNMAQFLGMQPSGSGPAPVVITDLQQQFQQQQIGGGQLIQQPHHHGGQLVIREPQQLQQQHLAAQQQFLIREQQQQQQLMIREQQQQQQHIGGQQQLLIRDHAQMQAQQAMDAQIAAAMQVREEQEMMRNFEQQQHAQMQAQQHQEMMRFHGGDQFGQMGAGPSAGAAAAMSPLLALGSGFDAGNPYHVQQQQQQQLRQEPPLLMLQPPQQSESEVVLQIQDQQLFHDPHHHLHPPGPGND